MKEHDPKMKRGRRLPLRLHATKAAASMSATKHTMEHKSEVNRHRRIATVGGWGIRHYEQKSKNANPRLNDGLDLLGGNEVTQDARISGQEALYERLYPVVDALMTNLLMDTKRDRQSFRAADVNTGILQEGLKLHQHDTYKSLLPAIDIEMTKLLKGFVGSTAEELSNGVRAIRIGNSFSFLGTNMVAGDTIYERHFYPHLVSAIRCADLRVLLLSNPGTGKSVFQFYLLARYLNPSLFKDAPLAGPIAFGTQKPPKVIIRHRGVARVQIWLLEQHVVHFIETTKIATLLSCFDPASCLYFYEPAKTTGVEPYSDENDMHIPTLATMSPDISRYKEYFKISRTVHMPVFTEDELVAIGRDMRTRSDFNELLADLYSDEAIQTRFAKFNGIIRHVLPPSEAKMDEVARKRKVAIASIDAWKFLNGDIESMTVSAYLAIYDVAKDENGVYDFNKYSLSQVNTEVGTEVQRLAKKINLDDRLLALQTYGETGLNKFGSIPSIYESVIADHLTSLDGVRWKQRNCSVVEAKGSKPKARGDFEGQLLYHCYRWRSKGCALL